MRVAGYTGNPLFRSCAFSTKAQWRHLPCCLLIFLGSPSDNQ
ncbi:hypothetical protein DZA65_02181 [Dickeya dianthicola]|nr:hypothetical protein DZA65_02181 [Dickeya dianthicola]